jgi:hypothetical protein
LKALNSRIPPEYVLLARDPYSRVESFFHEKLRYRVGQALNPSDPYQLKRHQTVFYPWLDTSAEEPIAAQVETLLEMSFDQYVRLIPEVWHIEDHLAPQTTNYTRTVFGRPIRMGFDRIVHVEDELAMQETAERFRLDLAIRQNASERLHEVAWSDEGRAIVRQVYAQDFEVLGYSPF